MARKFALIFGRIFAVIGVLGFINNPIVGDGPSTLFQADTAHNLVHLVFAAALLWAAYMSAHQAAVVLKVTGVIYLLVAIVGFFAIDKLNGLMLVNGADNWLHLVLAIGLLWGGFSKPASPPMSGSMPMGTM